MPGKQTIKIGPLKESELEEADRIARLAFGTFLGMPNPIECMGDRSFVQPRWHASNVKAIAAHEGGRLIGSNLITRWGSFGFFGPLTVLPEYWNRGVAQRLLQATVKVFDRWRVRRTGLFTFAHSPKHVCLYQKYGYWPQYLTAIMTRAPAPNNGENPRLLSTLKRAEREQALQACGKLTNGIERGLDLKDEVRAVLAQGIGDIALIYTRGALDGFGICMQGPGSEGGEKVCYIKFAAAKGGKGADERFDRLLGACEAFAASRDAMVEAGVNLSRQGAYESMRKRGYRVSSQGIAMQRPHAEGFNRADAYVIDDWR